MSACPVVQDRCLPGVDDFAVSEQGELLMTGSAIKALGLPISVTEKFKRVRKADQDSEGDVQMHLVPQEVLRQFLNATRAAAGFSPASRLLRPSSIRGRSGCTTGSPTPALAPAARPCLQPWFHRRPYSH